jgi:hypothetical protein
MRPPSFTETGDEDGAGQVTHHSRQFETGTMGCGRPARQGRYSETEPNFLVNNVSDESPFDLIIANFVLFDIFCVNRKWAVTSGADNFYPVCSMVELLLVIS